MTQTLGLVYKLTERLDTLENLNLRSLLVRPMRVYMPPTVPPPIFGFPRARRETPRAPRPRQGTTGEGRRHRAEE